jgi:prolipoprotein diacylglyceryltransferase
VFESYVCTGNYVFFQITGLETFYYSIFYFGLIILSVFRGLKFIEQNPKSEKNLAIKWFVAGYALFIIPTGIFILVLPDASRGVPSVLCGFAILMALVLALKVAPLKLIKKNDYN